MNPRSFLRQTKQSADLRAGNQKTGRVNAGTIRHRFGLLHVAIFFVCWAAIICGRLFFLQVIHYKDYVDRAARQQQRTFEVAPRRGILYDRNLHQLAMTVFADSIYAVPSEIPEGQRHDLALALSKIVHSDATDHFTTAHQIEARLNASRNFAWVARKLDPQVIQRVKDLDLSGVYTQKEFKRYYPNRQLAAQVLGYVGTDDTGLGGMERKFDHDLHGVSGRMLTALDARRHVVDSQEHEPDPGENLVLTVDENIQFMAERALDTALAKTHALNGTVVVQDPYTGQILALAMRPTFNPNEFFHADAALLKNHAVSDVYEPGSTFKLVTYSAAIQEGKTSPNELVDCQGGKMNYKGRIMHDSHANGVLTVEKALWESSDVAAVKIADRMGPDTFMRYIQAYGFGARSDIELPAETRGLLRPTKRWQPTSIASIAIGQEVGVTPVQLVSMMSTIANGGVYLPPHILMEKSSKTADQLHANPFHPEGELADSLPPGAHRVISVNTSATMRKMIGGVVLYGTAKGVADLNGYTAGGKTGTAQKIDVLTHRYSKTKYVASFVGIAPLNHPVISVAVIIDSPEGNHFGNINAGPVFREVAQQVLEYLGVPHDADVKAPADKGKNAPELEEASSEHTADSDGLFAEVNNLPADDPLRNPVIGHQPAPVAAREVASTATAPALRPAQSLPISTPHPVAQKAEAENRPVEPPPSAPSPPPSGEGVSVNVGRVDVPSFVGEPLRRVVESAATVGLELQIVGTGIAREQVPAPGSLVPPGTEVVVRFTR